MLTRCVQIVSLRQMNHRTHKESNEHLAVPILRQWIFLAAGNAVHASSMMGRNDHFTSYRTDLPHLDSCSTSSSIRPTSHAYADVAVLTSPDTQHL